MIAEEATWTPVDSILEEQHRLTAVEKYARSHKPGEPPSQQRYYRDLIPLTAPEPGQQYGFEVDLERCSGCQACVTACHSLNGLDDDEMWRSTGLLHSADWREPFQATVTTACHHCVDPGCLTGCPVLAYDKDPVTGIVRHLDDQCIGCQYCIMKCPYEVPQYSEKRGIVRKCDMCSSRLGHGEAPACVQACPSVAIRITLVDKAERVAVHRAGGASDVEANPFLPTSPDPGLTVPTTVYRSRKPLSPSLVAGDQSRISAGRPHPTLVLMLVLSQLAVGAEMACAFSRPNSGLSWTAAVLGALAIGVGTLHLGQPLKAWRAFLGWRTSWFSREVLAFPAFILLAACNAAFPRETTVHSAPGLLTLAAAAAGAVAVACSAMVYVDTHREFWRASRTFGKFFGTTVVLGASLALVADSLKVPIRPNDAVVLALLVALATAGKLALELRIFRHLEGEGSATPTPLYKTARLLRGDLGQSARARIACGVLGGIAVPLLICVTLARSGSFGVGLPAVSFGLCLAGELLERHLFFAAAAPAKMPGGISK